MYSRLLARLEGIIQSHTQNINQYKKTTLIFNLWTFPWIPSRQDNNPKNAVASELET